MVHLFRQKQIRELQTFGEIKSSRSEISNLLNEKECIDFDGYEITRNFYSDIRSHTEVLFEDLKKNYIIIYSKYQKNIIEKGVRLTDNIDVRSIRIMPFWNRIEKCDDTALLTEINKIFKKRE